MEKIDLNRVWDDVRAMGAASKDLLAAIAGMFILLPSVVAEHFMITGGESTRSATMGEALELLMQSYLENWPIVLVHGLVTTFGSLAMLMLLLRPERPTVGESLRLSLALLPGYYVAYLIQGAAFGAGLALFVVPGVYMLARLFLIGAVAAAERTLNPIDLVGRSFSLTRGNSWRIALLLVILFCTAGIINVVLSTIVGLLGALLLPSDLAMLLAQIMSGLLAALLAAFTALVAAAIYRAVTGHAQIAGVFD